MSYIHIYGCHECLPKCGNDIIALLKLKLLRGFRSFPYSWRAELNEVGFIKYS